MAPAESSSRLPDGKFKVVSLAMDFTGKKFIDEICTIGAFTEPNNVFAQTVMPNRDIAPSATRKHGLKVFNQFGRYRVLRDTQNHGKSLKTKSIYSTLLDFMEWLEEVKGKELDGIILAYHDTNGDDTTHFLLQALTQFHLMDKWTGVVKGYCNITSVALATEESLKGKNLGLSNLIRKYDIPKEHAENFGLSKRRSALVYKILSAILKAEGEIQCDQLLSFCDNQQDVLDNLERKRALAAKIRTLRPIFLPYIRKGRRDRQRAVQLRKHLIEIEADMETLESAFKTGGSDEIVKMIEKTKASRRKKDADELLKYIVDYMTGAGPHDKSAVDKEGKKSEKGQGDAEKNDNTAAGGSGESGNGKAGGHGHHHDDSETEDDSDEFEEAKDGVESGESGHSDPEPPKENVEK